MPIVKLYTIVTNDKYEFPVAFDLIGAKSVADYMGKKIGTVRKNICSGIWNGKYKAIPSGIYTATEFEKSLKNSERCRRYYWKKHG